MTLVEGRRRKLGKKVRSFVYGGQLAREYGGLRIEASDQNPLRANKVQ
jgi:hypothetical protein